MNPLSSSRYRTLPQKQALITGITGQDGANFAAFLLSKGYQLNDTKHYDPYATHSRVDHIYQDPRALNKNLVMHYGALTDRLNMRRIVNEVRPDEIYHLGSQGEVAVSFKIPEETADTDAQSTLRLVEAIRFLETIQSRSSTLRQGPIALCPRTAWKST
jgi:GDPmannose 4,6-dehydratase